MNQSNILSLLGIVTKAGKLVSGEFAVEKAIKDGKAKMVILAEDTSLRTKTTFQKICIYYKVPIFFLSTKEELGHYIGKQMRASIAITDTGFSEALLKKINQDSNGGN